jgi:ATP-dependent Clp protease ATP-binding subunit ClpB
LEGIEYDGTISDDAKREVETLLKRSFRPEFLNRLDETVFFKPLEKTEISDIVKLFLGELQARLAEKQIVLSLSDDAINYVVERGYDPVYGARPLKRFLQRNLETAVAKALLAGEFTAGDTMLVTVDEQGLNIQKA